MFFDDVLEVVGEEYVDDWADDQTKVFYKDGKPYGLIAILSEGLIASTAKDPEDPFTFGMLRYMIKYNRDYDIMLITDMPDYWEHVAMSLKPHGFTFTYSGDVLYSYRRRTNG